MIKLFENGTLLEEHENGTLQEAKCLNQIKKNVNKNLSDNKSISISIAFSFMKLGPVKEAMTFFLSKNIEKDCEIP